MRRLSLPAFTTGEILAACIASIRDNGLTDRLQLAAPLISSCDDVYALHGPQSTLYRIEGTDTVAGHVSRSEMERVYKGTFVKSKHTRNYYDVIKKQPPNDICPLCGQRVVSTLDHYLPQSTHPVMALTPANLIPACGDCNKIKLDYVAVTAEQQTLHPYYDNVDDGRWLFASVVETLPAALTFYVNPPGNWDAIKSRRILTHFETFNLKKLYASHSGVELNNIKFQLQELARNNPAEAIRDHLRRSELSCAQANANSWQRATYSALANSDWYCREGFIDQ